MRIFPISTLMAAMVFVSSTAWAGGTAARERAARKACLMGDFAKGVEILSDLFLDTGDLNEIFNQGRCLEQNSRYADAIARFREYLVKGAKLTSEDRADAERHITVCESYIRKAEAEKIAAAPAAPTSAAPPIASAHAEAPPAVTTAPAAQVTTAASDGVRAGDGLRTGGVITASVGAAALVAGIVLNLKVNSMTSDLEKPYAYNRSTDSTRETYKTMTWMAYGVGGAAVAAGAVLYAIGWSKGNASSTSSGEATVSLAPSLVSGVAGIAMTGAF
jgi:hypothetical protein